MTLPEHTDCPGAQGLAPGPERGVQQIGEVTLASEAVTLLADKCRGPATGNMN